MKSKTCPKCKIEKPISLFVTIYGFTNPRGKYCKDCYWINEVIFVRRLMEGSDYCLYCGKIIKKVYDWTEKGKTTKTYINLDHMNPISLGGKDSESNTVYCCTECNRKKSNLPFVKWLDKLEPKYKNIARKIYIAKHGYKPEKFKSISNTYVIDISYKS